MNMQPTSGRGFLDDVQTHVVRSISPQLAVYFFFRINDVAAFRGGLPAKAGDKGWGVDSTYRSEAARPPKAVMRAEGKSGAAAEGAAKSEAVANIAFTYSGLQALRVDDLTLASFPQPFREGMARRAALLGDDGEAAPDRWDGYLGSPEVHGVLWVNLGFDPKWFPRVPVVFDALVETIAASFPALRHAIVEPPNAAKSAGAWEPPAFVTSQIPGADMLHVEIGMSNYRVGPKGPYSVEHFGFRDGVSQPFLDIGLPPPPPGGGTPRPDDSWAPLRPGELLIGQPDEDGLVQRMPANVQLRQNGTYMAFRKLEQDVEGFRSFLKRNACPQDEHWLAAQMVGRWRDGSPLVHFPNGPGASKRALNNFRYQSEDPLGQRCPIGAHIRRANPRDTNHRDETRRHRLFRRGISYGGALLPDDSAGDGKRRGLLFISMQARLDHQFEFVQSKWLNRGEFSGQAGARRDPLTFQHAGRASDDFLPAGRPAPVTHLPRFVTMRGGDYFFVPSLSALKELKAGNLFPPTPGEPQPEPAIGSIEPANSNESKALIAGGKALLASGTSFMELKAIDTCDRPGGDKIVLNRILVGRYKYVRRVLDTEPIYSNLPYEMRSAPILAGERLLLGMSTTDNERRERLKIYVAADESTPNLRPPAIAAITAALTDAVLQRVGPLGRLDVVGDLGRVIPILCAGQVFGVTGPDWVSPTGIATRFGRTEVTEVADDWLASLPTVEDYTKPLLTMQTWTRLVFLQIFVNVVASADLREAAERAARELMRRIEQLMYEARSQGLPPTPGNLLQEMLKLPLPAGMTQAEFDRHVRLILAELTGGAVETVNSALVNVVNFLLDHPDQLQLAAKDTDPDLDARILEILRFDPVNALGFRVCAADTILGGKKIAKGTLVCVVPAAAMMDPRVFPKPETIDLTRLDNYLHFGGIVHPCLGRLIALSQLRVMVRALARLPQLRRAAGAAGTKRQATPPLTDSLVVRFTPI